MRFRSTTGTLPPPRRAGSRWRPRRPGGARCWCWRGVLLAYVGPAASYVRTWQESRARQAELRTLEAEHARLLARRQALLAARSLEGEARALGMVRRGERAFVVQGLPAGCPTRPRPASSPAALLPSRPDELGDARSTSGRRAPGGCAARARADRPALRARDRPHGAPSCAAAWAGGSPLPSSPSCTSGHRLVPASSRSSAAPERPARPGTRAPSPTPHSRATCARPPTSPAAGATDADCSACVSRRRRRGG